MYIGIDIGGTFLRIGLYEDKLIRFDKYAVKDILLSGDFIKDISVFLRKYISDNNVDPEAVIIGFPAPIDRSRKIVLQAPNINIADRINVVDELSAELGINVMIEKDVALLLYYDMNKYNLSNFKSICAFYFGTGIGNCIYLNNEIYIGNNGSAGELGHIPVDHSDLLCGCGNRGCMENLAGGKYLAKLCEEEYKDTYISDLFTEHGNEPLLQEFINRMAMTVATEINILDPEVIILGGGIINMKDYPVDYLKERIVYYTRKPLPAENLNIIISDDSEEKGVMGAIYYGLKHKENRES